MRRRHQGTTSWKRSLLIANKRGLRQCENIPLLCFLSSQHLFLTGEGGRFELENIFKKGKFWQPPPPPLPPPTPSKPLPPLNKALGGRQLWTLHVLSPRPVNKKNAAPRKYSQNTQFMATGAGRGGEGGGGGGGLGQYENKRAIKLHGPWLRSRGRHGGPPTGTTLWLHLRERQTRQHIQDITVQSAFFWPQWPQSPSKEPYFSQQPVGGTASTPLTSFLFTQPTFILGWHKSRHVMAASQRTPLNWRSRRELQWMLGVQFVFECMWRVKAFGTKPSMCHHTTATRSGGVRGVPVRPGRRQQSPGGRTRRSSTVNPHPPSLISGSASLLAWDLRFHTTDRTGPDGWNQRH